MNSNDFFLTKYKSRLDRLDYGARFYDPQLGWWHGVDPLAEKYESYSPFIYGLNNPIQFIDPFGREVVNAHKKEKEEAEKKANEAKRVMEEFDGDKKSKEYKRLVKAVKKETKEFQKIAKKFEKTERAIQDLKKYNPELFEKLDNLTDPGCNTVDVYIETVDNLKTDYFRNNPDFSKPTPLLGGAQTDAYQDEGSYYSITSKYGPSTATIVLDGALSDPGRIASHEGGHVTYNIAFLKQYIEWLNNNPNKSIGGHGGGNESGKEADAQEKIYIRNKYKK